MHNSVEFAVEKDAFRIEADVEEGVDEKWWELAEHILGEKRSKRYFQLSSLLILRLNNESAC